MGYTVKCPACPEQIPLGRGAKLFGVYQHHFWGGHKIPVQRSHELALLAEEGRLSESDIAELRQMALPVVEDLL